MRGCARRPVNASGVGFVAGVELTCGWRERVIHIVGLGIDDRRFGTAHTLRRGAREPPRMRITAIAQRLSAAGLPGERWPPALRAVSPTRTHMARALHQSGVADSVQRAFDKWLQRGRPGYVAAHWPDLQSVVQPVVQAGGSRGAGASASLPVSSGVLRELVAEFKSAGGIGIEVSLAGMSPADAERCRNAGATLCAGRLHRLGLP
jgi:predicted metal-dependent phosphoesterase TrpH